MPDAVGVLFSQSMNYVPNFLGDLPRATITASGTVDTSDRFVLVNAGGVAALTLPNGYRDGQPLIIKNVSTADVTVPGTVDLIGGTTTIGALGAARLIYSMANSSWLSV